MRPIGQGLQPGRHARQTGRDRKLGAQRMDRLQIERQRRARLTQQGLAHHRRRHIGIAVPVAADPGAHLQKTGETGGLAQHLTPIGVEPGDGGQKAALEIRNRVFDFVADGDGEGAQEPRLPEDRHVAQQRLFGATAVTVRRRRLEQVEVVADRSLVIQDTLAAHLAGMGGDHRSDEGARQQVRDRRGVDALTGQCAQGAGQGVRPHLAHGPTQALDPIFGDIGDLQKTGERMGEANRVLQAERAQTFLHPRRGLGRAFAMKGDGRLAQGFDLIEHRQAVVGADDVAQQPPQKSDRDEMRGRGGFGHKSILD